MKESKNINKINYNHTFNSKEMPFWTYSEVIDRFMTMLGNIDRYTKYHCYRVAILTKMYLDYMKNNNENNEINQLSYSEIKEIIYGAYVHDIGKSQVNSYILKDKEKLTEEEWLELKGHPANGAFLFLGPGYENIRDIILCHHERYDGNGYPIGYIGNEIPLGARIVCLIDSFDAMTDKRPYQDNNPLNVIEATEEIVKCSCYQFDPYLSKSFLKMLKTPEFLDYWASKNDTEIVKSQAIDIKKWIVSNETIEEKVLAEEKNIRVLKKILNIK